MRRVVGLVLALTVGLTPAAAVERSEPSAAERRTARAALRERLADRLPGLSPRFAKAGETLYAAAEVFPGGDLDKDGSEEVLDVRFQATEGSGGDVLESIAMSAHRGRDGKMLWNKSLGSADLVFPVPAKVGADGRRGLLVVSYDIEFFDGEVAFALVENTTVATYDATGAQVWSAAYDGGYLFGPSSGWASVYVEGLLDANPGGGDEVLVSVVEGAVADGALVYGSGGTIAPAILDGATGTARPLPAFASTNPQPFARPAGDLDGDRRADVVVSGAAGPAATTLTALRSSDGAVLWVCRDLPAAESSFPVSVKDATGDGVADVVVATSWWAAPPLADLQQEYVALVDGKTGVRKWTKNGARAWSLGGDVDRKPGAEVVAAEFVETDSHWGVRWTAYDAAGTAVWTAPRVVSLEGLTMAFLSASFRMAGDVNRDGIAEPAYAVRLEGNVKRVDAGYVDGRTGRRRPFGHGDAFPVDAAVDGRGNDSLVVDSKAKGRVTLSTYRGDVGSRLWSVTLGRATGMSVTPDAFALRADRDACAEVVVGMTNERTTTHYVISGATGRPLWSLSRAGSSPGKVRPGGAVRAHTRYAKTC